MPSTSDETVQRASRAVAWNVVLSVSTIAFAVITSIAQVRLLTKPEFGLFTVATNLLRYASILTLFTFDAALMRYVPEFKARGDRRGMVNLLYKVLAIQCLVWAILVLVTAVLAGPVSKVNKADMHALLYTGIAVVLPSVLYLSLQAVLTCFYEVKVQAVGTILGGLLQLAFLWAFVRNMGLGGPGAMMAQLGMSGLLVVFFAYQLSRRLPQNRDAAQYQPFPVKRLIAFSLPYVINTVAAAAFRFQSQVFFLQPYWGEEVTATFGYAYMLAQRFLEFVPAVFYGVGNVMAADAYLVGREQLARVMELYWRIIALATAAVSVGGFVLADRLILLLFGAKAADAGGLASILFLTQACITLLNPYMFVMRAEEKTWLAFWLSPPAAIIAMSLNYLFIPKMGITGAMLATSLSYFLVTGFQYVVFRRAFSYLRFPFRYIARSYVAAIPMLAAIPIKNAFPGHLGLLAGFIAVAVLWAVGVRACGLIGADEADLLRRSKLPGSALALRLLTR